MISLGISAAAILIPLAIELIDRNSKPDGTPLSEQEIQELRALVDQRHAVIQALEE